MIKILKYELRTLKKDIVLYCTVLTFIYSLIASLTAFAKSALDDIDTMIQDNTEGMTYSIKITNPDEQFADFLDDAALHDISYSYINENRIFLNPSIIGEAVVDGLTGNTVVFHATKASNSDCMQINDRKEDCIILSETAAQSLGVSVGDEILFQIQNGSMQSKCMVGGVYVPTESTYDFFMTPECERRILSENRLSEKYYLILNVDTYDECAAAMRRFETKEYKALSALYTFIYGEINNIYIMCKGILSMNIVLCIALTAIFVSFFTVIFIRRSGFISLLIHQGMSKKRIIQLYWLIIESMHILVSIISVPVIKILSSWIRSEYFLTFDTAAEMIRFDLESVIIVFFIVACILAVSMFFSQKNSINYIIELPIRKEAKYE